MTEATGREGQKRTLALCQGCFVSHPALPPSQFLLRVPPDLTCQGPQPVNLDVIPKVAPRAVEGGDGQGRVEERPRERSGCGGREARLSVWNGSFERPTKSWTRRPRTPPARQEHLCCGSGSCISWPWGNPSLITAELSAGPRGRVRGHSGKILAALGQAPHVPFHLLSSSSPSGTRFTTSVRLTVGLGDLEGLFQPE